MTTTVSTITVQCEHKPLGGAMLRRPSVRCDQAAVALTGHKNGVLARFYCGEHLVEHLDGINRVISITDSAQDNPYASNWEIAQTGHALQLAEADLDDLNVRTASDPSVDFDGAEWERLDRAINDARGRLLSVLEHS